MKIAVISDMHMGNADGADHFGHDDGRFVRFLRFLEDNFQRIVLLGDLYETLNGRWPGGGRAQLQRCRNAHSKVAERFEGAQYLTLQGNHDLVLATEGAPAELRLDLDGVRMLFIHGHQHDWGFRHVRRLGETMSWLGGWLKRTGLRGLIRRAEPFEARLRSPFKSPERCRFQQWAVALARERDVDVIVTAHTHERARAEHGDRLFLNSGACTWGRYSFASIDTGAGVFDVHDAW